MRLLVVLIAASLVWLVPAGNLMADGMGAGCAAMAASSSPDHSGHGHRSPSGPMAVPACCVAFCAAPVAPVGVVLFPQKVSSSWSPALGGDLPFRSVEPAERPPRRGVVS